MFSKSLLCAMMLEFLPLEGGTKKSWYFLFLAPSDTVEKDTNGWE